VVLGAGGMLATALVKELERREQHYISLSEHDLDITFEGRVITLLKSLNPGVVVNAAAYTDVDGAESNRALAFEVNAAGAGNVARAAAMIDALMVQVSTDYVFDGRKGSPFRPDDPTGPINIYGVSKLEGEKLVAGVAGKHLIVRTSWLFGPGGRNFVTTMLKLSEERDTLKVIDDQVGSPTFTDHLAPGIMKLARLGTTGIHHLSNSGICTWFEFAAEIFRLSGAEVKAVPCTTAEYPTAARRPANSVLDCSASYASLPAPLPSWQEALALYIGQIEGGP
jgi:dTDP-4-dehydrorhamnose reductase